jgi:hypothetical protein
VLAAISLVASSRSGKRVLSFFIPSSIMFSIPFLSDTNLSFAVWSMLAGMVDGGRFVGVFLGDWYHPEACSFAFFTTYDCSSSVCDGATNHGEFYFAACIAKFGDRQ